MKKFYFMLLSVFAIQQISAQTLVPTSGISSISGCGGTIQDPGGSNNYPLSTDGQLVIYPSNPGQFVKLDFSNFNTEKTYDFVEIYDGIDSNQPKIGKYSGTLTGLSVTATTYAGNTGALTLRFSSDGSTIAPGFSASVSCESTSGSYLFLDDDYKSISSNGGSSYNFSILSNIIWTATDNASWITIETISGTGNTLNNIIIAANNSTSSRQSVISVSGGGFLRTIEIYQSGRDPLSVSKTFVLDQDGAARTLSVSPDNYTWNITSKPDWVTISTLTGVIAEVITITSTPNTGENRSGIIKFNYLSDSVLVTVYQLGSTSVNTTLSSSVNQTITGCNGTYFSPGGIYGYPTNLSVNYTFVPDQNKIASLDFVYFETESNYDKIRIYNGNTTTTGFANEYSGFKSSFITGSSSNNNPITINFRTDGSTSFTGFAIKHTCLSVDNIPANGTVTITSCNTKVTDSGLLGNYANGSDGTIIILPTAPGLAIKASFSDFDLESSSDQLYVNESSYSGNKPKPQFSRRQDGSLAIRFTSDGSITYRGFIADISCVVPQVSVSPSVINAPKTAQSYTVTVTSNIEYWSANTSASNVSLTTPTFTTFNIELSENTSSITKNSVVTVTSGSVFALITIQQEGTTTDITEISHYQTDKVYPNPSSGKFYVETSASAIISISNSIGNEILTYKTAGKNKREINGFESGIYFVNFTTEKTKITKKLIIE